MRARAAERLDGDAAAARAVDGAAQPLDGDERRGERAEAIGLAGQERHAPAATAVAAAGAGVTLPDERQLHVAAIVRELLGRGQLHADEVGQLGHAPRAARLIDLRQRRQLLDRPWTTARRAPTPCRGTPPAAAPAAPLAARSARRSAAPSAALDSARICPSIVASTARSRSSHSARVSLARLRRAPAPARSSSAAAAAPRRDTSAWPRRARATARPSSAAAAAPAPPSTDWSTSNS